MACTVGHECAGPEGETQGRRREARVETGVQWGQRGGNGKGQIEAASGEERRTGFCDS